MNTNRIGAWLERGACMTALCVAAALPLSSAGAQQSGAGTVKEETPGLLKQAKIAPDAARRTALARVAGGTVASQELEKEKGKLVYSFDITVPGKSGVEEVLVDAMTGTVVSQEHENAKAEAAERAEERDDEGAELAREAKITPDSARHLALARVPGGKVASRELEREKGRLVYSFDITVAGKSGVEEVLIDARTGALVSHEHESAKAEADEKAKEQKEAHPTAKPRAPTR